MPVGPTGETPVLRQCESNNSIARFVWREVFSIGRVTSESVDDEFAGSGRDCVLMRELRLPYRVWGGRRR